MLLVFGARSKPLPALLGLEMGLGVMNLIFIPYSRSSVTILSSG